MYDQSSYDVNVAYIWGNPSHGTVSLTIGLFVFEGYFAFDYTAPHSDQWRIKKTSL